MRFDWIKSSPSSTKVILFFCGWGTTPEVVAHLSPAEDTDLLGIYDYSTCSEAELPDLSMYEELAVVAWSMGVWAAEQCASTLQRVTTAVAVNGTPLPMHDRYGIPLLTFEGTLRGLNDMNRERFDRRMCGGRELLEVYRSFSQRPTEDLRTELTQVYQRISGVEPKAPCLPWSQAVVSQRDMIMPAGHQEAYWRRWSVPIRTLEGQGHYPFMQYQSWDELCR